MKSLKGVIAASAMALASSGAMALTPGDVVFSTDYGCTQESATASFTCVAGYSPGAEGMLFWEAIFGATGKTVISSITFNGDDVDVVIPGKSYYELNGPFSGDFEVVIKGSSTGKGSVGGSVSVMTAVPEPETYAMLLAGLAAVGFMARRRRA
jgi:hypothetical protein